jgi:predicted nucleic acid-binding OB-fold protein
MRLDSKCILDIEFAHFTFKNQNERLQIISKHQEAMVARIIKEFKKGFVKIKKFEK